MDWKSAIAHLKTLEGASEAVGILEGEVTRLTNANFGLVGEVRTANSKSKEAEGKLTDLLQLLGAEGEDLKAKADSANEKVKTLQSENSKLAKEKGDIETKYQTLESEATGLKRRTLLADAATKSGAVADVLTTLAKDIPVERIVIENDGVAIASEDGNQKTALKEYAQAQWAAFVPALFPSGTKQNNQTRLPGGTPNGGTTKEESPLKAYRASTYDKTIERMTNKAS